MKKTVFTLIILSGLVAACHERKADYEGSHSASEKAHQSLDGEANDVP